METDRLLDLLRQGAATPKELRRAFKTNGWTWTMRTDQALMQLRMMGTVVVGVDSKYRIPTLKGRMP